jgi:transposase
MVSCPEANTYGSILTGAAVVEGGKERLLLEKLLKGCKERGYLRVRGRQHTDSTHVLGALGLLSKWERTAQTIAPH